MLFNKRTLPFFATLFLLVAPFILSLQTSAAGQDLTSGLTFNETDNPKTNSSSQYTLQDMFSHGSGATSTTTPWQESQSKGDNNTLYTWRLNSVPTCATKLRVRATLTTDPSVPPVGSSYGALLMLYKVSNSETALQGNYSIIQGGDNSNVFGNSPDYPYGIYKWSEENPDNYTLEAEWTIDATSSSDQFGIAIVQVADEDNHSGTYAVQTTINRVEASGDNCSVSSASVSTPVPSPPKTAGPVDDSSTKLLVLTGLSLSLIFSLGFFFKKALPSSR